MQIKCVAQSLRTMLTLMCVFNDPMRKILLVYPFYRWEN